MIEIVDNVQDLAINPQISVSVVENSVVIDDTIKTIVDEFNLLEIIDYD